MIALPLLEGVRPLIATNDVIAFDGWDVLDRPTVNSEPRIFRYDPEHTRYADWDLYEVLMHDYPRGAVYEPKCYLHMKLVKRDWVHKGWSSPNDLASRPYPAPGKARLAPSVIDKVKHRLRAILARVR